MGTIAPPDLSERLGARTRDISGSASGFAVYDDVSLHVGYRVHAHLYCLSRSTPSYLVAEDSRGIGVLQTLGDLGMPGHPGEPSRLLERAWSLLPRFGSPRRPLTAALGRAVSRIAALDDVAPGLLLQIERDERTGFSRHIEAKMKISRTYPTMVEMIGSIP